MKEYESKHCNRLFRVEWKNKRPWLTVERNSDVVEVMFCDFCIKAAVQSGRNAYPERMF